VTRATAWLRARPLAALAVAAAVALGLFALLLDHPLTGPLAGTGDVPIWEFLGFYLWKNVSFRPLPHLDLVNDQAFFPYGVDNVFQPWGLERDGFFALCFSHFGPGPWLQLYYLLSLFVTLVGAYALLRRDFGHVRATLAGVAVTFLNFYAIRKYPGHMHICIVHWTVLGILADFVIVRRVVRGEPLSLRLVLLRLALASLCLGQDLGYIAGFGLTSLTVSLAFLVLLTAHRLARRRLSLGAVARNARRRFASELRQHKLALAGVALLFAAATFLYVPLAAQIAHHARRFDFSALPFGTYFASPWRLLLPYLPYFNPLGPLTFADQPEGLGGGTVGWTLLLLAAGGLVCARRHLLAYVPLLVVFLLCLTYRPVDFPTLKIFPWFAFNRAATRATTIYAVIFVAFALSLRKELVPRRWRRPLAAALGILGVVELGTALSLGGHSAFSYPKEFFSYMSVVRGTPGEALLDWPFCAVGGNGVGGDALCPYYVQSHDDFALRTYHQKKVVGQYFGRLHPAQLEPFRRAHWERLFAPDTRNIFEARGQIRCFTDEEWDVFTEFFALNDFAGVQLHPRLLPAECGVEFARRYGAPVAEVHMPDGDDLAFIAKPAALRARVDAAAGRGLVLRTYPSKSVEVIAAMDPSEVDVSGLDGLERKGDETWRWGLGARTELQFSLPARRIVTLRVSFYQPVPNQEVRVVANGAEVARLASQPPGPLRSEIIRFEGARGMNSVSLHATNWNHGSTAFAPADPRPLSLRLTHLILE
jgi:hypothetical protein